MRFAANALPATVWVSSFSVMSSSSRIPPRLLIDATDCPVKAEIYRLAQRYGLQVVLVSASDIGAPFEPWITKVVAGEGAEAETIANEASATDFVVTDNKELAALLLAKGTAAYIVASAGRRLEKASAISASIRARGTARSKSIAAMAGCRS